MSEFLSIIKFLEFYFLKFFFIFLIHLIIITIELFNIIKLVIIYYIPNFLFANQ